MSFTHSRQEILSGIGFNTIIDGKFKTNMIVVKLFTSLDTSTVALNSLAVSTISSANGNYKTIPLFSQRLSELYGSSISSDISKIGDVQVLTLIGRFIDERYAFDGEDLTNILTDMLLDCIFNPVAEGGSFNEELFNISKKELLDTIDGEVNNKRTYAIIQSKKTVFRGEPSAITSYGDRSHTEQATSRKSYEQFKRLLSTCNIEIFYVGSSEKPSIMTKFKEAFSKLTRTVEPFPVSKPSLIKASVEEVTSQMDVSQSKMVIALKTTHANKYNNSIMNTILGLSPFSKLFTNVREKLSLCYYCQSSYDNQKRVVFIDSGVELQNIEKAKESILEQVEDIKNGNFTDDDVINAKKYLCNSLKSIGDTPYSYVNWYFANALIHEDRTIDGEYARYSSVTRQDIIDSAKDLTLDTIYVLKPLGVD